MKDPAAMNALVSGAVIAIVTAAVAALVVLLARRRQGRTSQDQPSPGPLQKAEDGGSARDIASEVKDLDKRVKAAAAAGNNGALAALYLDLARCHAKLGDEVSRMTALRSAAGCGSQHGPDACHAEARLELAEAAYRAGDLTTACEQWQMARTALLKDGQTERHAKVEKRMRDNGCPTDWVLTDF